MVVGEGVVEFECEDDTVDVEERDVEQLLLLLLLVVFVVLFLGGVGGGAGLVVFKLVQSFELRLGERREGKLRVFVHCARLRTIFELQTIFRSFSNNFLSHFVLKVPYALVA